MSWDAVVVGAGPNGLVAANRLLDAGWAVLLLEAQPTVGGAVRSDRDVHPDFVHDTFSAFYPLAASSPTIASFDLAEHGLEWSHAPSVLGHPLRDGSWAVLHRERTATAAGLDELHPGDGEAWLELCAQWDRIGPHLVGSLLTPFPPVRSGVALLSALRTAGGLDTVRMLLTPMVDLARERFGGEAARVLLAGNAGHADIPLEAPGSGLMGLLLAMMGQTVGFPVPCGGAGELTGALARRFVANGGTIRTDAEVTGIQVRDGRAHTVVTADGEGHRAIRAVVADVLAPALYTRLLDPAVLPGRVLRSMQRFELDPGTVKVDWALDRQVPWTDGPELASGTVHIADDVRDMSEALAQVRAGAVPAKPFMLTGQMTTADPTRSPGGTESFWAYSHVPQETGHDAGDGGITGRWDRDDCERFADRMQARLEEVAPGFGSRILARRVLGPRELEARDANLAGGALNGGTAQLQQQLVFRPVPGLGRAETPVKALYLGSASAHPGGGVHGACGDNAARAALAHDRVDRLVPWRAARPV
ncbi:phytoene desaturase family protein [Nocardioides hwasunensis]|uniref:Pyridine nucleotide-disulfide oxidoreductase domain-containing protein 2 n=1 Tax=Nocardioides hwasunensis TaxID=397258 RepID=A0ABR8MJX9_9ACTN|nr:NAD(P)/FAD-dependent oxidoreductase [Nocardioides hwasunensis]MBD3914804.1 NAD(P)/FAD-dependent oxidoreductase [Nocardioides hwasunensis]